MRHIPWMIALAAPVMAQEATLSAPQQVIADQIAAFGAQDARAAFAFASPMIQQMFGSSDVFGQMVQRGYPMVWMAQDVQFLGTEQIAGGQRQRVMVTDPQGRLHLLEYDMIETPLGWRINGVQLLTGTERGA